MTMTQDEVEKVIKDLQSRVKSLEEWKAKKQKQQITLPIDDTSKNIIRQIT